MAILQGILRPSVIKFSLKIVDLKINPDLPGVSELPCGARIILSKLGQYMYNDS